MKTAQKESNEEESLLRKTLAASQVKFNAEKLKKIEEYRAEVRGATGVKGRDKILK